LLAMERSSVGSTTCATSGTPTIRMRS
jgi:hypothetical protein